MSGATDEPGNAAEKSIHRLKAVSRDLLRKQNPLLHELSSKLLNGSVIKRAAETGYNRDVAAGAKKLRRACSF
ncbi:MAG: hypothetical protein ACM3WV_11195 [Bacillota bacterium]